jgi:hypothetical protein
VLAHADSPVQFLAMNIDKIRELRHAEPFVPFCLHLPDGREVTVTHPDFIALAPSGRRVSVYHADDSESIIDVMLVSDVPRQAKSRRSNGKK